MAHAGACHCKRVTFETELAPMLVFQCNCNSCRRFTGSMGVRAMYASDEVEWTGEVSEYAYQGGSGGNIYTQNCPNCHTCTYATLDLMDGITVIPIGMFDESHTLIPKLEIWSCAKLGWLKDDGCIENRVPDMGVQERLLQLLEALENR